MKKLILVLAMVLASSTAHAEGERIKLSWNDNQIVYGIKGTVVAEENNLRTIWTDNVYTPGRAKYILKGLKPSVQKRAKNARVKWVFACKGPEYKTYGIMNLVIYDRSGATLYEEGNQGPYEIIPGSIAETIRDITCGVKLGTEA